ncbi:uncharacterized protein LOC143001026 isoform X2 [Genypterus blacodes]
MHQLTNGVRGCITGCRSPIMEAVLGFVLGAVGGCILGATEDPVNKTLLRMTSAGPMKPVLDEVQTVGALGLGSLVGATALTIAMTSVVAGVILAAVIATLFVATLSCGTKTDTLGLMTSVGLAGAFGTTLSGATLGVTIEWIVENSGMVGLLWALSIFTVIKPPVRFLFNFIWQPGQMCWIQVPAYAAMEREQIEAKEFQQRERVTVQIEKRILLLEKGGSTGETGHGTHWDNERRQREAIETEKRRIEAAEVKERDIQMWINTVVAKHVDFLAFSGIPMTLLAMVTSGFGVFGYGGHQSVFIALLALVGIIGILLLKAKDFKFWMLVGCMGMFATFVIAVLTLHAGQVVVTTSMKMRAAGHNQSREDLTSRMNHQSALEALHAGFFVAKLCQLALGAAVAGPLVRQAAGAGKVIVGAALVAGGLLVAVEALAPVLGDGGKAGALLGVVGAAGVSVGAATTVARGWSSWLGTIGTLVGLVVGSVGMGKYHIINMGLQVPVAYVFAMTNPL